LLVGIVAALGLGLAILGLWPTVKPALEQNFPCPQCAGYPTGGDPALRASPLLAGGTGTTDGTNGTLSAVPGKYTYLCGFTVSPGSATTGIVLNVTLTGAISAPNWEVAAPATAAGVTGVPLTVSFAPYCIPSGTPNSAIQVVVGALGAGGINQA